MSGAFQDDFIDQIRSQADIVEVIGQYVSLKKRGRNWVGLCPFHNERTPSFSVNPEKGIYKCFGCGKGGDIYSFLMDHEKISFVQCVELLAGRLGLKVPRSKSDREEQDATGKLVYANQFARDWYKQQLTDESGSVARQYLESRGLDEETLDKFEFGWAPNAREGFKSVALQHGIAEATLIEAGLLSRAEESGATYDRFRGRIMIPILDPGARVIAFGGRILGEGEPKYLNSPETPVFHKGEVLFGLDKSRGAIRHDGRVVVVEGYMDLVSLYQGGIHPVVAPMGTALSPGQAMLLRRYAREVFLLYDADTAGLKATFRSGDELLAAGLTVRVITLPSAGMDPDDYIRAEGRQAFERLMNSAADFLDRKIEIITGKMNLEVTANRQRAADKLLETVVRCRDALVRSLYLKKVADFIEVPQSVLEERLRGLGGRSMARAPRSNAGTGVAAGSSAGEKAQRILLELCLREPDYVDRIVDKLGEEPFTVSDYGKIFRALAQLRSQGVRNLLEALYQELPEDLQKMVGMLRLEDRKEEPADEVFNSCWRRIKIERLDKQLENIRTSSVDLDNEGLMQEQISLERERKDLQQGLSGGTFL
ncbi:MAG: DNA primase [Gemmatimonadota bacterium]|nr:DNA primase [Gemmatimonadota bacterium]